MQFNSNPKSYQQLLPQNYIEAFFYLLWFNEKENLNTPVNSKIRLPSTIFIRDNTFYNWFFTNSKNQIKRKRIENITYKNIYNEFCAGKEFDEIVALRYTVKDGVSFSLFLIKNFRMLLQLSISIGYSSRTARSSRVY